MSEALDTLQQAAPQVYNFLVDKTASQVHLLRTGADALSPLDIARLAVVNFKVERKLVNVVLEAAFELYRQAAP